MWLYVKTSIFTFYTYKMNTAIKKKQYTLNKVNPIDNNTRFILQTVINYTLKDLEPSIFFPIVVFFVY